MKSFLKPMNCPHHCEIYKAKKYSYKDLPVRLLNLEQYTDMSNQENCMV